MSAGTVWHTKRSENALCPLEDSSSDEDAGRMFRDSLPEHNTT